MIKVCGKCGSTKISKCGANMYSCSSCGHVFYDSNYRSIIHATIFLVLGIASFLVGSFIWA